MLVIALTVEALLLSILKTLQIFNILGFGKTRATPYNHCSVA